MRREPRVLVVRVSRFPGVALSVANAAWPQGEHRLVSVPAGARLTPWTLCTEAWGREMLTWRPDVVVTQWWNEHGDGHAAVDAALLLMQPRGFHVVFDDGSAQWVSGRRRVSMALQRQRRTIRNVAIVVAIAVVAPVAALMQFSADLFRSERSQ